ncbi:MAG: cell wall hydrolase [Bacilli bacterium]
MNFKRLAMLFIAVTLIFTSFSVSIASDYRVYQVKAGDTLWRISETYHIDLKELKRLNGLKTDIIQIDQKLKLPSPPIKEQSNVQISSHTKVGVSEYVVKHGDSLWSIANRYNTSISEIKKINGLLSNVLQVGDIMTVATADSKYTLSDRSSLRTSSTISYTKQDYQWLAIIIEAEAEDEPYEGKLAVGSVVMNRVKSDNFPDDIQDVIFQKTKVYQFTPVANGRIYRVKPSEDSYKAATEALKGEDPTDGALYFYNPKIAKSDWIRKREIIVVIGQHNFAL